MELFTGQVLRHASDTITPPPRPLPVSTFRPPPQDVADVIQQMGCGKAVGLDEVPAEILKAGGDVLAIRFRSLIDRIVQSQQWRGDGKAAASPRYGRRRKITGRARTAGICSYPTM